MPQLTLSLSPEPQKKVAVISHERSGTHFLMNTLAENFGYIAKPWWNLDFEQGLNFHATESLENYFRQVHNKPVINVLKSHHPVAFFKPFADYFCSQFQIFYIYRDPRDTMLSNWHLINHGHARGWDEGPNCSSVGEFIRSAPRGAMLRYQKEQEPTVLHRWESHVRGWLSFAATRPKEEIFVLQYEDLNDEFNAAVEKMSIFLGKPLKTPVRPNRQHNVIQPGPGISGRYRHELSTADCDYFQSAIGPTLEHLGYEKT